MEDIWILENEEELFYSDILNSIANRAMKFEGTKERNILKKLWPECSWKTIKSRLNSEGSIWYVWWMDGVRTLANIESMI